MAKKKLSDEDLIALLSKAVSECETISDGKHSEERIEVEKYYRGELPKQMHTGDAKYVSRDVFDAVDSMRATILEAFSASNRIVYFRPERGETVNEAKQATEYARHVFFKTNPGEDIMYEALTEGLMKRFAIAKVYYDRDVDEDEYDFDSLTMEELTAVVSEHESFEFGNVSVAENGLVSGSYTVPIDNSRIRVEILQPEDIMVSSGSTSLDESKVVVHRAAKSKSKLLKEGFDKKKVEELSFSELYPGFTDYEKHRRFEAIDEALNPDSALDEAGREVMVYEVYTRIDREGTGKSRLWKFTFSQDVILSEEQIGFLPFASFVPLPIPHTYYGENYAKSVIPIQNARTVLIRQIINHSLATNNARTMVLNGTVLNPNELLDNRIGGIVNVRRMDGLAPIPQAPLNPFVFNLIGMIDEDKEEVTGISKLSQGMNKDAISSQNAQGMVEQLISASQQRQKIIARRFGLFMKDLFLLINRTAIDSVDEADYVDAIGEYVEVNPKAWVQRSAASVELSLGYGEAAAEAQKWTEIDQYFMSDPMLNAAYPYERRYEVITRGLEKRGIEDVKTLLVPPDEMKPPEPSQAEKLQMAQAEAAIKLTNAQAESMIRKSESDAMKAQAELIRAQTEAGFRVASIKQGDEELELKKFVAAKELVLAERADEQRANYNPDV